ncbi:MAG: acetylglutamate kinase [Dehalococcoidia bacterium]
MTAPSPIVVKIGGSTLGKHDTSLEDLAALHREGHALVVVHGGGATVSEWLAIHGVESRFVRGLRVTDERALQVVVAVLAGVVNKELVARLNALGARAMGLTGADGAIIRARRYDPDLGHVGEIVCVGAEALRSLLAAGFLPVLAPIGLEAQGQTSQPHLLNINADTAAAEVARALAASHLIFLTDVPGVHDARGRIIYNVSAEGARDLVASGAAGGGMIPKLEAALRAIDAGTRALIIDGRREHALQTALQGEVTGTVIGP